MKQRCQNHNSPYFKNYGGRGIKIDERWLDFKNFLSDMGHPPPGLTLERINNNGNYEPGNCKWATRKEQNNNRRDNWLVSVDGETRMISEWANIIGMNQATFRKRLDRGWTIQRAMNQKVQIHHLNLTV